MRNEEKIDYSLYEVYKDGRVYSKYWKRFLSDKPKKYKKYQKGYVENQYQSIDGEGIMCLRHQVIWYYFNGKVPEGMEIDHIIPIADGGTNELSNLRVVTHGDNMNNEYTVERLRKANLGEKNPMYGKKFSEEHKRKIGEASKRRWVEGIISKDIPVDQIDPKTGEVVASWKSATDCARQTDFKQSGILYAAHGGYFDKNRGKWHNINQYKGYIWKYVR